MKKILFIILTFLIISCNKDDESSFKIHAINPYSFDVEISSSLIEQDIISANSTKTLTGTAGNGTLYGKEANCTDSCVILGEQGSYSNGNLDFTFDDGEEYYWTVGENNISQSNSNNNNLVGKWINLSGCQNANGGQTYFKFNSNYTGKIFNSDCYSSCTGYGYYLNFNWTDNNSSVTIDYTSVSEYCGVTAPTPNNETMSYSISGNQLSIGGAIFTKQ